MMQPSLGSLLVQAGVLTPEQLAQADDYRQQHPGCSRPQAAQALGLASERQMLEAQARLLGLGLADAADLDADRQAVALIPRALALQQELLPLRLEDGQLLVAVHEPPGSRVLHQLHRLTGEPPRLLLCERAPLRRAIRLHYADAGVRLAAREAASPQREAAALAPAVVEMTGGEEQPPVIRLLDDLVQHACACGASDLHLEPMAGGLAVRLRVDGALLDYLTLDRGLHAPLTARVKILAGLDIAERRLPQDGHFRARLADGEVWDLRVSVLPTLHGEKTVLRLLGGGLPPARADQFGMDDNTYARFLPLLDRPSGLIYLTGPTGCGKTTTLYMVLRRLADRPVNIATVEDPVERDLERINQTQINPAAGLTFEAGLRALLRQDPDILMVGETRDAETAAMAVRAAITGHTVFSTLHTTDALSAIVRLREMGVEPYLLAGALSAVAAQRLVRRVCPRCGRRMPLTEPERALLGPEPPFVRRGAGCPHCRGTGYAGRIAIHELAVIDPPLRRLIAAGAGQEELAASLRRTQAAPTLWESGLELVRAGLTTPEEIVRAVWPG